MSAAERYVLEAHGEGKPAIEVRGVSKRFKIFDNPVTGPIREVLQFWRRREPLYREFPSVDGADFVVGRGEVVGIIGPNGAGKTTLLKMIAGLLAVDSGTITVRGKITALLALGVGVHPEFNGRENIYYGGLLLGMSRKEILEKTDSIIAFAELGQFIDLPFRTYSSGMRARLLFSIAMSIEPDILIVDEALATGDAYFVAKCIDHIRKIIRSGATILYVSHNLTQVQEMCARAVFMAEGRIQAQGHPTDMVAAYNEWMFRREAAQAGNRLVEKREGELALIGGNGAVRIRSARMVGADKQPQSGFHTGEHACIELDYESELPPATPVTLFIGFVREEDGQWVGEINSNYFLRPGESRIQSLMIPLQARGKLRATVDPLLLLNGHYHLWVMIYDSRERYCEYRKIAPFFVARQAHVFDRGPTYWQPCVIEGGEAIPQQANRVDPK